MKLQFHTNLDEAKQDVRALSDRLAKHYDFRFHPSIPRVGERVQFNFKKWSHATKRSEECYYTLEVVGVNYDYIENIVSVELHMPRIFKSIKEWTEYIRRHRDGKDY